jgi:hypothetical protein
MDNNTIEYLHIFVYSAEPTLGNKTFLFLGDFWRCLDACFSTVFIWIKNLGEQSEIVCPIWSVLEIHYRKA